MGLQIQRVMTVVAAETMCGARPTSAGTDAWAENPPYYCSVSFHQRVVMLNEVEHLG